MKIKVNNIPVEVAAGTTLGDITREREIPTKGVAVAVNDHIVSRADWAGRILEDGDDITVITAAYGG